MKAHPLQDAGTDQAVAKLIGQIGDIATLPEVTLKIIETVEDPRSTARDLHEIVTHDLALSARILRVANSAFYGLPGQIASIDRAIVMLGLNAVKNIAIAASLSKMFRGGRISRKYSARDLWVHGVAVGTASKLIVESMRMELPDEAFLAGLIHDIGLVVMLQSHPDRIQEIARQADAAEARLSAGKAAPTDPTPAQVFAEAESKLFGAGHEILGAALARKWKFPRPFQYVIGHHHQPQMLAPDSRLLTQVTHTAETLCSQCELGMVLPIDAHPADPEVMAELRLNDQTLGRIRQDLPEQVTLARGLFD